MTELRTPPIRVETLTCLVCDKTDKAGRAHPCSFQNCCTCWRGEPCKGPGQSTDKNFHVAR